MSSDLACVGLGVESEAAFDAMVREIGPKAQVIGASGRNAIARWEDPSGARLTFHLRDGSAVGFVPSFAGAPPGVRFGPLTRLRDDLWSGVAVDEHGDQWTSMVVDLEESAAVPGNELKTEAALVALGRAVKVFRSEAEFGAADASLLDPSANASDPPAHVVERGWPWPPRMSAESFISIGAVGDPADADATARLNGVVVAADRNVNAFTGQSFVVARVRCLAMEADVCLAGADHPAVPEPGSVIGGLVYLVASVGSSAFDLNALPGARSRLRRLFGR